MAQVIITVGGIASGKSTWARKVVAEQPNHVIVERDELRRMQGFGPIGTPAQEKTITKIQRGLIETALLDGLTPIVSDTNTDKSLRNSLVKFIHKLGADVYLNVFDTPLHVCIERNAARAEPVPEKVVRKKHDQLVNQVNNQGLASEMLYCETFEPVDPKRGMLEPVVVVDLDGTLAIHNGRSPYDYDKLDTDKLNHDLFHVLDSLDMHALFVSGRPDSHRALTDEWIRRTTGWEDIGNRLFMRKAGDQRPDYIVKNEIYDNEILPKYNVVMVFDDRDQVVRHVRARGITVAQINYGRF
jgi:predicted kinase